LPDRQNRIEESPDYYLVKEYDYDEYLPHELRIKLIESNLDARWVRFGGVPDICLGHKLLSS